MSLPKRSILKKEVFEPAVKSVFFKMDIAVKKARQMTDQSFELAGIDLTTDQWIMMDMLNASEPVSQRQLVIDSAKDAGTTTRILDLLCKKAFIVRLDSSKDRRSFDVMLTAKGKEVFNRAQQEVIGIRKTRLGMLSKEEFNAFNLALGKIYAGMM